MVLGSIEVGKSEVLFDADLEKNMLLSAVQIQRNYVGLGLDKRR